MSTLKHTPGPYLAIVQKDWPHRQDVHITAKGWGVVATVSIDSSMPHLVERQRANLRLLQNAPELLAALMELVEFDSYESEYDGRMYTICPSCGDQDGEHREGCSFTTARALIAKAHGENSHG